MRTLFIGCVESSYTLLEELLKAGADIVGVITKKESKYNSDFKDLTPLCEKYKLNYIYVKNVNDEESIAFAESCNAQIAFCFGWSQLIKQEFMNKIPNGIVGFHPAELPNNRGRHPVIWALVLGLRQTASTFFMIDDMADRGAIISQEVIEISYEDDAGTLYEKIMSVAKVQVVKVWNLFKDGTIEFKEQNVLAGNTWRKRSKDDGKIDWRMSSRGIYNLVRGLTRPYVGAHFVYKEKEIKVWKVSEIITNKYENIEPGKVVEIYENNKIDIKVSDNVIRLEEWEYMEIGKNEYL